MSQISGVATTDHPGGVLASPVGPEQRISAVDVLRGLAVLGILVVNIEYFGLPHADKSAAGTEWVGVYAPAAGSTSTLVAWIAIRALFEGKMRAIFAMLFGAGAALLTSRLERRGERTPVADIYYRRTLWLLVFGLAHAYLLWEGDILYSYALVGLFLFPFRNLSGRTLVIAGACFLALSVPRAAWLAHHREEVRAQAARADADLAAGKTLDDEQKQAQSDWAEVMESYRPDAETMKEALDAYRGGYARLFARRAPLVMEVQSWDFYGWAVLDLTGMMLLGMGLLKLGVLTATRSRRFYFGLSTIGYALGLPVTAASSYVMHARAFDPVAVAWLTAVYDPARLAVALGHIGLVMALVQSGRARWLTGSLQDVGRMALTSYLSATVICTTLFNGYGLGLFASLGRRKLYAIVLLIWGFQLLFSRFWLRTYRFGPAEWLWRSLTYWKRQPLRRTSAALTAAPSTE